MDLQGGISSRLDVMAVQIDCQVQQQKLSKTRSIH